MDFFVTSYCSFGLSNLIILEKLGDIGYSNFAAKRILIVAKCIIKFFCMLIGDLSIIYLSNIPAATNNVSGLYSFF